MARRTRSRFVRPAPRTKMWIGTGTGQSSVTGSSLTLLSSLSAGSLALRPFTVLRTHILLTFESDQTAGSERGFGTYGQIVVTDAAVAIGPTAIPDPSTILGNPEADWFVSQAVMFSFKFISGVGVVMPMENQYIIDSHAMRKVGPDDDIAVMFAEDSSLGAVLTVQGRRLIQLH